MSKTKKNAKGAQGRVAMTETRTMEAIYHELGHGFFGVHEGGIITYMEVNDHGGVTQLKDTEYDRGIESEVIIALGGYIGACLYYNRKPKIKNFLRTTACQRDAEELLKRVNHKSFQQGIENGEVDARLLEQYEVLKAYKDGLDKAAALVMEKRRVTGTEITKYFE